MFEDRPFLATIDQRLENGRASVSVAIGRGDKQYTGAAEGTSDPHQRARLVGEATLRAVEELTAHRHTFDLTAIGTSDLGPVRIALAQIRETGWSDYLIGSAMVRDDDSATATAKAVLDALNRRISRGT
ncbi:MAG TPA: hypothetical protein VIW46_03525 [Acidimicrobiia bacterium]|jgi:hypothetical protein